MVYTPVFDISPTKFRRFTHRPFKIALTIQMLNRCYPQRNTLSNSIFNTHVLGKFSPLFSNFMHVMKRHEWSCCLQSKV